MAGCSRQTEAAKGQPPWEGIIKYLQHSIQMLEVATTMGNDLPKLKRCSLCAKTHRTDTRSGTKLSPVALPLTLARPASALA